MTDPLNIGDEIDLGNMKVKNYTALRVAPTITVSEISPEVQRMIDDPECNVALLQAEFFGTKLVVQYDGRAEFTMNGVTTYGTVDIPGMEKEQKTGWERCMCSCHEPYIDRGAFVNWFPVDHTCCGNEWAEDTPKETDGT